MTATPIRHLRVVAMPGADGCAERLAATLGAERCAIEHRRFPDGETYLRVLGDVTGLDVALVAQLRDPDAQVPGLLFLAETLRDMGASSVGLVAPYLPYMRQDARFLPGEAVTSRSFARLLSSSFDWLVTVDPHLHRHKSLDQIYAIPAAVVPSAPAIALWVRSHVAHPHIIGPDEESAQWVAQVAAWARCPHTVLSKQRRGDRDVEVTGLDAASLHGCTPVVVDDIVSSAHTMAQVVGKLSAAGSPPAVCIGVHAVFASDAEEVLRRSGAACVVTCNTIPHPSNAIDVTAALAEAVRVELETWRAAAG
jgi:ribose-phosphate pyrophosphokinase